MSDVAPKVQACIPCKTAKHCCRFGANTLICQRCEQRGLVASQCVIQPCKSWQSSVQSNSVPLPETPQDFEGTSSISKPATRQKRSHSEVSHSNDSVSHSAKQPCVASQMSHTPLDSITEVIEEDESLVDTLISHADSTGFPEIIRALIDDDYSQGEDFGKIEISSVSTNDDSDIYAEIYSCDFFFFSIFLFFEFSSRCNTRPHH